MSTKVLKKSSHKRVLDLGWEDKLKELIELDTENSSMEQWQQDTKFLQQSNGYYVKDEYIEDDEAWVVKELECDVADEEKDLCELMNDEG